MGKLILGGKSSRKQIESSNEAFSYKAIILRHTKGSLKTKQQLCDVFNMIEDYTK